MITLAIDCATPTAGLAFLDGRRVVAELSLDTGAGHAELLLPALERLSSLAGLTLGQVDLLACTHGPGSFTGLRIGVSTVKGLAFATGKPIVGVSTLAALAFGQLPSRSLICPLLDARKRQLYAGLYREGADGLPEAVVPDRLTDIDALSGSLAGRDVDFVGEAALLYQSEIERAAGAERDRQRFRGGRPGAAAVAAIAQRRYQSGQREEPSAFVPRYLRLSEAEDNQRKGATGECAGTGQVVDLSVGLR